LARIGHATCAVKDVDRNFAALINSCCRGPSDGRCRAVCSHSPFFRLLFSLLQRLWSGVAMGEDRWVGYGCFGQDAWEVIL
jgi:hypothetical protein